MHYSLSVLSITLTPYVKNRLVLTKKSLFLAAEDLIRQADGSNPGSVTDVLMHMVYCPSSWKRVNNFCLFSTWQVNYAKLHKFNPLQFKGMNETY